MYTSILGKMVAAFAVAVSLIFIAAGCDMNPTPGFGTMEVRLHDAPGEFEEVNVYVKRVEVNREDSGEGWITINEPEKHIDLLKLVNGNYEVLGEAELEAGTYHQIRLILGNENNLVIDGETKDLFVPSGQDTGVKLNINTTIHEGEEIMILLDFNVEKSIVMAGPPQEPVKYLLKPVIRASNFANTGNIAGVVTPAEARPVVRAISSESDTISVTFADSQSGEFKLIGLPEDSYTVSIQPRADGFEKMHIENVTVNVQETTDLEEIELTATDANND